MLRDRRLDVVAAVALALQQQVGLADRVGLGVDLLAEQVRGDVLAVLGRELPQRLLGHGQHAAGAAGAVVEEIRAGLDPVGDGQEDEPRHQPHGVARRPVLARLLVVLLVEAPDQLLEYRAHAVVVEPGMPDRAVGVLHRGGTQVDVGRGELLDQRAQRVGLRQPRDLVAELEVVEDVLHVGGEPVEPSPEVGLELLSVRAGAQVPQGELRCVVEVLFGHCSQRAILLDDASVIEQRFHLDHVLLGVFQHGVQSAQHGHRQDHVAVLAADVEVPQDIVRDAPDVVGDPVCVAVGRRHADSGRSGPLLCSHYSFTWRVVRPLFVPYGTSLRSRPAGAAAVKTPMWSSSTTAAGSRRLR